MAEAAEVVVHVVHGNEQDIGLGTGRRGQADRHQDGKGGNETNRDSHGTILLSVWLFGAIVTSSEDGVTSLRMHPFYGRNPNRSTVA
jgi:hypothetical protein